MQAKAIFLKGFGRPEANPLGGVSTARDMGERRRYNADDAEVGGHGSGL